MELSVSIIMLVFFYLLAVVGLSICDDLKKQEEEEKN